MIGCRTQSGRGYTLALAAARYYFAPPKRIGVSGHHGGRGKASAKKPLRTAGLGEGLGPGTATDGLRSHPPPRRPRQHWRLVTILCIIPFIKFPEYKMSHLLYDVEETIATITLNRPEASNAYSSKMVRELVNALDEAEGDDEVRVVIVTGAGRSFCAGGDLKAMRDRTGMFSGDPVELRDKYLRGIQTIPRRFDSFEKPTIAAINGAAIGAGLGLAATCDLRISAEGAKFGSTFARVGLIPGDGGAYLLTRVVGFSRALELILTAEIIDARRALDIDLVHRVVPDEEVMDEARKVARQIASLPPKAVRTAKAALYRSVDRDLETSLHITAALQGLIQRTEEHDQAVRDLLENLRSD